MSDGDVKRDSDGTRRGAEIRRYEGIPLLFLQWCKNSDIVHLTATVSTLTVRVEMKSKLSTYSIT